MQTHLKRKLGHAPISNWIWTQDWSVWTALDQPKIMIDLKIPTHCCHYQCLKWCSNYYTYLLTYSMEQSPSWEANWLNLQPIKKFPAFYGTRKFITVLTSARHLSLSWANSIQFPQPLPTSRSILILSSHLHLGLPNGLFPSGFQGVKIFPAFELWNRGIWF